MFQNHVIQLIVTAALILLLPLVKYVTRKLIRKYAAFYRKLESRTNQVIRVFSVFINLMLVIVLIIIWGVDPRNLLVALSSIFAVIGVAMFAQWSILSNITAGLLIFFTSPFKIGDYIHIQDKDMDFDAKVLDILTFYTHLETRNGEKISYPNSLFFQKGIIIVNIDNWDDVRVDEI